MKYILIDGLLNGTGIRLKYEGGYISPELIGLSNTLCKELAEWLFAYANEHYKGYGDTYAIIKLDEWGLELAKKIKAEVSGNSYQVGYFSDAKLKEIPI